MIPQKLKPGDTIMFVPVSRSLFIVSSGTRDIANTYREGLWLKILIWASSEMVDGINSLPIQNRVDDIHKWFLNSDVKALFTVIGGFNSIQLLEYLDYNLIQNNPKILCGYSDVTVILNAI